MSQPTYDDLSESQYRFFQQRTLKQLQEQTGLNNVLCQLINHIGTECYQIIKNNELKEKKTLTHKLASQQLLVKSFF